MLLKEKHLLALDKSDFLKKSLIDLENKIKNDDSGSCWHIEESLLKSKEMAEKLDDLPKDKKIKMPFYGLSIGVKDLFCVKGMTTTAGSKILEAFVSPYSSTVWKSLEDKGVMLGAKVAMDEFAMGSFSNTSYLGRVSVPRLKEHSAGGSSGGSAASVSAGVVDFSLGSDTGGSVRLPASFCSTVGYKPSYGTFSRYGMIAYASSLDQAGFLTKNVEDVEYLLSNSISVKDDKDMTSKGIELKWIDKKISDLKVGYFPEFLQSLEIQDDIKVAYKKMLDDLAFLKIKLIPVNIPNMQYAAQIYYTLACSEASSNLAKFQGVFFGKKLIDEKFSGTYWEQCAQYRSKYFGSEVQKRIMLGSFILSSENYSSMYQKSVLLRKCLTNDFNHIFSDMDSIVLPTSPMTSPKWENIGKMTSAQIYLSDFMTVPFSLAGLPAVSVPWFKSQSGLGIGMQWVGKYANDYQLIKDILMIEKEIKILKDA